VCDTDETPSAGTTGCSTLGVRVIPGSEEFAELETEGLSDPRAERTAADYQTTTITFRRIDDGDCTLFPSTFWLYSDGEAEFRGAVATDSSGDVWLVRGMALLDRNGVELYRIPQFNGPRMDVTDYNYPFHVYPLYYPSYLFPHVTNAQMYHHC